MGETQSGGRDAFFYVASSADSDINVRQRGTSGDDTLSAGIYGGNNLWLLGNSDGDYSVESDDGNRTLQRSQLNSQAGFLLSYTVTGDVTRGFTFNDEDDASTEVLNAVRAYDGDVLVGGKSNGNFSDSDGNSLDQPILARISLAENTGDEETASEDESRQWQRQVSLGNDEGEIISLENYRDDEIVALLKISDATSTKWEVRLFTGEGVPLH